MPPTQSGHHPPWPWAADECPPMKRPSPEKAAFSKRLKTEDAPKLQSSEAASPNDKVVSKSCKLAKKPEAGKMQQGKITEYFKAQMKCNGIKKDMCGNVVVKAQEKFVTLLEPNSKQINGLIKSQNLRKVDVKNVNPAVRKVVADVKARKLSPVTVPRKILPAPSKMPEKIGLANHVNTAIPNFAPTVTLTAVSFPPNLTYLHTKAPKPPDNIFVQQFAAIPDKISAIPIINRTCLLQPIQKLTAINNFNCMKLNGTVVPIVKLNTMPSRINGSANLLNTAALNVETAVPTVLSTKPMAKACTETLKPATVTAASAATPPKCQPQQQDSDSGISSSGMGKDLQICVTQPVSVEAQKSPILSQPKTIRFPAKQHLEKTEKETKRHSGDTIHCRWDNCHTHFDTSGALLEHLQVGVELVDTSIGSRSTKDRTYCREFLIGYYVMGQLSYDLSDVDVLTKNAETLFLFPQGKHFLFYL